MELAGENAAAVRHLQVHQRPVPVLPAEHAALAELAAAQPVVQRLFRQDPADARPAGKGRVLGAAPGCPGHVRERVAAEAPQTVQAGQVRQRQIGQRTDRSGQQPSAHAAQPSSHVGSGHRLVGLAATLVHVVRRVLGVVVAVLVVGRQSAAHVPSSSPADGRPPGRPSSSPPCRRAPQASPAPRHRRGRGHHHRDRDRHHHHHQAGGQATVRHREPDRARPHVRVTRCAVFAGPGPRRRGRAGHQRVVVRRLRRYGRRRHPAPVPVHRAGRVPRATDGTVRPAPRGGGRGRSDRVPRPSPPSPAAAAAAPPPQPTAAVAAAASPALFTVRGVLFSAQLMMRVSVYRRAGVRGSRAVRLSRRPTRLDGYEPEQTRGRRCTLDLSANMLV